MAEEGLAGQPDHDIAVLAERPQHAELVDAVERLAQDIDALRFQLVEMVHDGGKTSGNCRVAPSI